MVTVYSKTNCIQCDRTKKAFDRLSVEYRDVNIEKNPEALQMVKEMGYMSAPVVVVDEGNHWSGYRSDKIKELVGKSYDC